MITDLLTFYPEQLQAFILIFMRIVIVLFLLPIFGSSMVSARVKAGLALIIAMVLFPVIKPDLALFPDNLLSGVNLVLSECVIGMIIGQQQKTFEL